MSFEEHKFLIFLNFYFNFIFGCIGSLLLRATSNLGELRRAGATLRCGAWASHCGGFSLQSTGSRHVGSVVVARGP